MHKYTLCPFFLFILIFGFSNPGKACAVKIIPTQAKTCMNTAAGFTLNISNATAPYNYYWTVIDSNLVNNFTSSAINPKFAHKKVKVAIKVTDASSCIATDTLEITVNALPHVSWKTNPLASRCYNYGDFDLTQFIAKPLSTDLSLGKLRIYGKLTKYGPSGLVDSISPSKFNFKTSAINNAVDLQGGKNVVETLTLFYRDSNGCENSSNTTQRINGIPIIELDTMIRCENTDFSLDPSIIRPKVKFGTRQSWTLISTPNGKIDTNMLSDHSGGAGTDWWMNTGPKGNGAYTLQFKVLDQVTGCYSTADVAIYIDSTPVVRTALYSICQQPYTFNLCNTLSVNGHPAREAYTIFSIFAFNGDTTSANFGNAKIENRIYLNNQAKIGKWSIHVVGNEGACPIVRDIDLNLNARPKAGFTTSPANVTPVSSPIFNTTNTSTISPTSTLNYEWYFNKKSNAISSNATSPQITYPAIDSTWEAMLIAISDSGCADTFVKKLIVGKGNLGVHIFNSNLVKIDNRFVLQNFESSFVSIRVFDLWGRQVYYSQINTGGDLPKGGYVYLLELKNTEKGIQYIKGKKWID